MNGKRYIEGARAHDNGTAQGNCPYAPASIAFQDWTDGWAQADAKLRLQSEQQRLAFMRRD